MNAALKINELFEKRTLDPAATTIVAIAFLYEQLPAPYVWTGTGPDPYAVPGEDGETRQLRMVLSKVLPTFQPHFIPGHLRISSGTRISGHRLESGQLLDAAHINARLAGMLAESLKSQDLGPGFDMGQYSALSVSGNSLATGEARIALLAKRSLTQARPAPPPVVQPGAAQAKKLPEQPTIRKGAIWKLAYGSGLFLLLVSLLLFAVLLLDRTSIRSEGFVLYPIMSLVVGILLMYSATRPPRKPGS